MICPFCRKPETKVVDKRNVDGIARRRRECLNCKKRFTTFERPADVNIYVKKKDGRRELYDREKLKKGVLRACEKRSVSLDRIEKILDLLESQIRSRRSSEIKTTLLGQMVMTKLRNLDKVAYVRFASVYKDFQDIDEFKKVIKEIK